MSAKICTAVLLHFLAILHLRRRLRTDRNLRGNIGGVYDGNDLVCKLHDGYVFVSLRKAFHEDFSCLVALPMLERLCACNKLLFEVTSKRA